MEDITENIRVLSIYRCNEFFTGNYRNIYENSKSKKNNDDKEDELKFREVFIKMYNNQL